MQNDDHPSLDDRLLGPVRSFTLEDRIFHAVCLIILFAVGLNVPFNWLIGLPGVAILMAAVFFAIALLYVSSRVLHYEKEAKTAFLLAANIVLALNYIYNSGLNGPTYAIFLLVLLITVAVAPRQEYALWLPLNFLTMLVLFVWDFYHPGWLHNSYPDRANRYTDFIYTYAVIGGLTVFVVNAIRRAYLREHLAAERQTTELTAANEVKNKLLSIIAHDLKEPLSSVQNFLELIEDHDLTDNQRIELQKELKRRTQNASELLHNLLSWTKGQMEGFQVNKAKLNLHQLLMPVLKLLEPLAEEKAVVLSAAIPENLYVMADADMLQFVFRNLVVNAIKYSHPAGEIGVRATGKDGDCLLEVSDQGDGIASDQQASLFSLETQPVLGTLAEKGTGLGLYLCYEFMQRQEGMITYTTVPGQGTTFLIKIPSFRK